MCLPESIARITNDLPVLAFYSPGPQEMMVVGVIALLLFGKRLPEVAKNLGKGLSEFKKGMQGFQDEVRRDSDVTNQSIDCCRTVSGVLHCPGSSARVRQFCDVRPLPPG